MINVGESTVSGHVHSSHFILRRDPQQLQLVQNIKERPHRHTHPSRDHQNLNHMSCQKPPSAPHQQPVWPSCLPSVRVHLVHILLPCKQCREDDPPGTAPPVKLSSLQRIVVFQDGSYFVEAGQD
uniref:Uncharacterized protein n=1 Tax=Kalanchoe fedtschenkoi TaxID=63787 RepID=A0A7N0TIL7_KALFE